MSILPTTISTSPTIKFVHIQQPNCGTSNSVFSSNYHNIKLLNYDANFSFKPRTFLKWMSTCFHDNSSRWVSQIFSVCLFALCPIANAQDQMLSMDRYACEDVQNYYASVDQLKGEALTRELNSIIAHHHSLSYKEVWDALKILDAAEVDKPETSYNIVEIYSARTVPKSLAGRLEGWNREHLWPRSYGLKSRPSLTDLHNIRPADVNVNSSRGNKYFGECRVEMIRCLRPANKEAAFDTEADWKIWAPPVQVRGDVARAVMYMAVRYRFPRPGEGPGLRLSDTPNMAKREMGLLSVLLKWNELDPPSKAEKLRNERICRLYQHNRNPFVDHPEYATLIWKQTQAH
ncbi:hypothetical protein RND81_07G086000 [Saponaria officinalis]|uniref:Endonuclease I n=1 Tax=Saponaria officinalis TaxID=3572 RepID=A0AAW1JS55_SAPOF